MWLIYYVNFKPNYKILVYGARKVISHVTIPSQTPFKINNSDMVTVFVAIILKMHAQQNFKYFNWIFILSYYFLNEIAIFVN